MKLRAAINEIPVDSVRSALEIADLAVSASYDEVMVLGELLLQSFRLHDLGRFEASHISSWTVIERCMNIVWESHLEQAENKYGSSGEEGGKKFINRERKDKLTGRDFTMSIISEVLSLSGKLPREKYDLSNNVRQVRNSWLHKLSPIGRKASTDAINLARFMLRFSEVLDVDVPFFPIGSIPVSLSGPKE